MKFLCTILSLFLALQLKAEITCHQGMQLFFNKMAPATQAVSVSGFYTKKSQMTGQYKPCVVSVKLESNRLAPQWTPATFDSNNGDGGGLWPFGSYPTVIPVSDEYRSIHSFECTVTADEISMALSYRNLNGWYETRKSKLSILKNNDDTFDFTFLDGGGSRAAVCRGQLSGK